MPYLMGAGILPSRLQPARKGNHFDYPKYNVPNSLIKCFDCHLHQSRARGPEACRPMTGFHSSYSIFSCFENQQPEPSRQMQNYTLRSCGTASFFLSSQHQDPSGWFGWVPLPGMSSLRLKGWHPSEICDHQSLSRYKNRHARLLKAYRRDTEIPQARMYDSIFVRGENIKSLYYSAVCKFGRQKGSIPRTKWWPNRLNTLRWFAVNFFFFSRLILFMTELLISVTFLIPN